MHSQIVLFDGFDPLDAVPVFEILAAPTLLGTPATVEFVSAEGPRLVPSGLPGIALEATGALDPTRAGVIVVPGAHGELDAIPAILARTQGTKLPSMLSYALRTPEVTVATVCGGSLILAMAGLIVGRHANTHHMGIDGLTAAGVTHVDARVVDDGDLISAGSVTSGLDLAIYLLEREYGSQIAHSVERLIAYERRGVVWRNA